MKMENTSGLAKIETDLPKIEAKPMPITEQKKETFESPEFHKKTQLESVPEAKANTELDFKDCGRVKEDPDQAAVPKKNDEKINFDGCNKKNDQVKIAPEQKKQEPETFELCKKKQDRTADGDSDEATSDGNSDTDNEFNDERLHLRQNEPASAEEELAEPENEEHQRRDDLPKAPADRSDLKNPEVVEKVDQKNDVVDDKVFEKQDEYEKTLGSLDDNDNEYIADGKLLSNTKYNLNGNEYKTDENGRIISCESTPRRTPENLRDNNAQVAVGGENRMSGDQGGHIVGRDMGGNAGLGNLVAMDSRINQSDYKRMENDVKKALDERENVNVKTDIEYSGPSERPDKLATTVTADGKDTVYTFDNNMEGSLMDKLKETCNKSDIEVIKDVLNSKGGVISSMKEEFNSEGKLDKTSVSITYTGEDGKNYRRPVVIKNDGGVYK